MLKKFEQFNSNKSITKVNSRLILDSSVPITNNPNILKYMKLQKKK